MPHSHLRAQQNTALDGIRGLAALLVLMVHFHANFGKFVVATPVLAWASEMLGGFGRAGVGIFYTMTGYFIYAQLISKQQPYLTFVRRRIRRIYPVFFVVFCMYLALFALVPGVSKFKGMTTAATSKIILQNLLLLPGVFDVPRVITVAWTLSYIVLFYLVAPIFVQVFRLRTIGKRPALWILIGSWFAYAGACVFWNASPRPLMFFTGMILYQVSDSRLTAVPAKRWEVLALIAMGLAIVFSWLYYSHREWLYLPLSARFLRQLLISGAVVPFMIYCIYHHHGLVHRLMSNRVLVRLGTLSYSWYLIQGITLYAVSFVLYVAHVYQLSYFGFMATLAATILANAALAYTLFRLVEKPLSIDVKKAPVAEPNSVKQPIPAVATAGKN